MRGGGSDQFYAASGSMDHDVKVPTFSVESASESMADETLLPDKGLQRRSRRSHIVAFPWRTERDSHSVQYYVNKYWEKPKARFGQKFDGYGWLEWLGFFLPCVNWLRTYNVKEYLLMDIVAGLSVGFMVIPQGMSYASIAGLPAVYGLYGAFVPVLIYSLFGSSKQLAVGPVAVTSLLISSGLQPLVPGADGIANPNNVPPSLEDVQVEYNHKAIQLSFIVACLYTAAGILRLGFLTNFLSHSLISGFTSGAALIIGLSQVKYILGYNVPRSDSVYEQIELLIENIYKFVWQEYVMGMSLLFLLLTMKFCGKRFPRVKWMRAMGPLTACIVAMLAVYIGDLGSKGIYVISSIQGGLPQPTISWWFSYPNMNQLIPLALIVLVVDLLESTSIARALALKNGYEIAFNQEIVGLGLANFGGAAFNAYTTTGSFSRSAVNNDSGAKTGLAGFVTSMLVMMVLLFLTPLFRYLPYNALAAIVMSSVAGLFEWSAPIRLWKLSKLDWLVWTTCFLCTCFLGVELGLAISIGLALLIVVYESAFPHTALLGRIGETQVYRNVKQYPDARVVPGVCVVRVDAPIYFANVQWIRDRLLKYELRTARTSAQHGLGVEYLVLDMSPVTHVDAAGLHMLGVLCEQLHSRGVRFVLCNPNKKVVAALERGGVPQRVGREWIFVRVHDAMAAINNAWCEAGRTLPPCCPSQAGPESEETDSLS